MSTLRRIHGVFANSARRAFETKTCDERLQIGRALVKGQHREALRILGETLSPSDEDLARTHYSLRAHQQRQSLYGNARIGLHDAWHPAMASRRPSGIVSMICKEVKRAIEPALGEQMHRVSANHWQYRTPAAPWTIVTNVYFRQHDDVTYDQEVRFGAESESVCRSISVLDWLGIWDGGTGWTVRSPIEIPIAVSSLVEMWRRFLSAAPDLLPGKLPRGAPRLKKPVTALPKRRLHLV